MNKPNPSQHTSDMFNTRSNDVQLNTSTPEKGSQHSIDELKEKLAAIEHERWSDWQKWMHSVLRRSGELTEGVDEILQRWDKQIATPYSKLSATEKASDMEQVDRYWPLIKSWLEAEKRAYADVIERELLLGKATPLDANPTGRTILGAELTSRNAEWREHIKAVLAELRTKAGIK